MFRGLVSSLKDSISDVFDQSGRRSCVVCARAGCGALSSRTALIAHAVSLAFGSTICRRCSAVSVVADDHHSARGSGARRSAAGAIFVPVPAFVCARACVGGALRSLCSPGARVCRFVVFCVQRDWVVVAARRRSRATGARAVVARKPLFCSLVARLAGVCVRAALTFAIDCLFYAIFATHCTRC